VTNAIQGKGKHPLVICRNQPPDHNFGIRKAALEALGVKIISLPSDDAGTNLHPDIDFISKAL
jgi:hypothetical protein